MIKKLNISEYIELAQKAGSVVIDARSPKEFAEGHLLGAINLPLLNDEERHTVGIIYKQQGNEAAVEKGFELVGGKFADYVRRAKELSPEKKIMVYCWRGGLRSNIMAWLLSTAGMDVTLLTGGYKAWRNHILALLYQERNFVILGGKTGCGKTEVLEALQQKNQHIIQLEGLAHHKGSAFGGLGQLEQDTQEHFENKLADQLLRLPENAVVWLENESRFIGRIRLPDLLYNKMQAAPILELESSIERRTARILTEYSHFPKEALAEKTRGLSKRMGGENVKKSLEALEQNDFAGWVQPLLEYYDKTYEYTDGARKPPSRIQVECDNLSAQEIADKIIESGYGRTRN